MSEIYNALIYKPLYNGLILLMDLVPFIDAGVAVIIFTIIIKLILFPLSKKAVTTQLQMKNIEPDLEALKAKHGEDRVALARSTMELYKTKGINPFMSILLLFIQLPIIFALYRVFWHSGLPNVNMEMLYDFISRPENIKIMFLGLIDITKKNILLAVIVGATTYLQARFMSPILPKAKEGEKPSFKHDLAKSMHLQMRYVFPVIAAIISYNISAAISLYWSTSNVFTICQELYLRKKLKN